MFLEALAPNRLVEVSVVEYGREHSLLFAPLGGGQSVSGVGNPGQTLHLVPLHRGTRYPIPYEVRWGVLDESGLTHLLTDSLGIRGFPTAKK